MRRRARIDGILDPYGEVRYVVQPLLLQYYQELPERREGEEASLWNQRFRRKLHRFKQAVQARYQEGTLQKLIGYGNSEVRQAAVLSLGLVGTMASNACLALRLHDEDCVVRHLAGDALWSIWFRADTPANNQELQRLMRLDVDEVNLETILQGFDALIQKSPTFAEAFNQRALVHYRANQFTRAVTDCEKVLRLNPFHFGAANGMAQCFMKQRKFRAALRSYRRAHRINPNLEGVQEAIASLEKILGEEGRR